MGWKGWVAATHVLLVRGIKILMVEFFVDAILKHCYDKVI